MPSLSPTVAVVDDEPEMRKALQRLLAARGFRVHSLVTGEDLLALLSMEVPDCVVLDLHMPGLNGYGVLAECASRWPRVPIVVITGHDEPEAVERVRGLGAAAYLRKPVDEATLCEALETAINGGHRPVTNHGE